MKCPECSQEVETTEKARTKHAATHWDGRRPKENPEAARRYDALIGKKGAKGEDE